MECFLRVFNEVYSQVNVTGPGLDSEFYFVDPYDPTSFSSISCNSSVTVTPTAPPWRPTRALIPASDGNSRHFSLLLTENTDKIIASVLTDADTQTTGIDNAGLRVVSALPVPVDLFGVVDECYDCALPKLNGDSPLNTGDVYMISSIQTSYPWSLRAWSASEKKTTVTSLPTPDSNVTHFSMQEHGSYTLLLHANGEYSFLEDAAGRNADLPLLFYFLGMVLLGVVHRLVGGLLVSQARLTGKAPSPRKPSEVTCLSFWGYDKLMETAAAEGRREEEEEEEGGGSLTTKFLSDGGSLQEGIASNATNVKARKPSPSSRVLSLDTFRGFALCIMMLANFGGGRYSYLDHSRWNGLTVADLLFPWFVFMSGVSAALSQSSEARRGAGVWDRVKKTVIRSLKLL